MNKKYFFAVPLTGIICLHAAAPDADKHLSDADKHIYLDSTNRLTLSLRYALNFNAKFKGVATGLVPNSSGAGSRTPDGAPYNYTDGYVLTDSTGNFGGQTSYWGYNDAAQYDSGASTFTLHSAPSESSAKDKPLGLELTYDRQFGEKDDWHNLRYGVEAAVNYMNISLSDNDTSGNTVVYNFGGIPGDQPPPGFQGSFNGNPGDPVIVVPPVSSTPGAFISHDKFSGNL